MLHSSLRAAAFFALLASCAPAASAPEPAAAAPAPILVDPAREAAAAVDGFHAALGRGDTAAAADFVADDALIFEEGGVERGKAEYAASHLAADAEFSKAVKSTRTARVAHASGELAWVASESRVAGTFRGREVDRAMVETMVLRRTEGAWRIVHIHWSSK
jgi:ketosteroid isomerase-like protein